MAKQYRVRRDLPDNSYVQVKSTTKEECKRVLRSLKDKWADLAKGEPFNGEDPYVVTLKGATLTVTQGERVVDRYVMEPS